MKKILSLIIIGVLCFSMFSVLAPQVKAETTTLKVNTFDESGFSPSSLTGFHKWADVLVSVYTLEEVLVASGLSDDTGSVVFSLDPGSYVLEYGGVMGRPAGEAFTVPLTLDRMEVDVTSGFNEVDMHVKIDFFHFFKDVHGPGSGGWPLELNYIDLDISTPEHEDTINVLPGETVNAEVSFWELETINVPVWYASLFGSWDPTASLSNLASGVSSPSSHNLHTMQVSFTAPLTEDTHFVRLVGVYDYTWPNSYYTGYHYNSALGKDMGVGLISKSLEGPYGIGTLIVEQAPQPPVADFTYSPTSPDIADTVYFNASGSYDPDGGNITSYVWDFGDGKSESGMTIDHKYKAEGTYTVTLNVTDDEGQNATTSASVTVIIRMYHELFLEIDYMEGHAPSYEALTYIKNYFRERRINILYYFNEEISIEAWNQIDPDNMTSDEERWEFERTYNNLGDDSVVYFLGIPIDYRLERKWKWVLYGPNADDPHVFGFTYCNEDAGNHVFVAKSRCEQYGSDPSREITPIEVETMILMHELGHSIGILTLDRPGTDPDRDGGTENYDNNPWSVMNLVNRYEFNELVDERYSEYYWRMRDMEYYEI